MPPPSTDQAAPPFGRLERPDRTQDAGIRVDFDAAEFSHAIANHGYRMSWTRRAECPCPPLDPQSTQPDPNCARCSGTGYLYFGPSATQDISGHQLTDVQQAAIAAGPGFLIYGLMMPISARDKRNERFGTWLSAEGSVTVMPENRLSFRDRLVNLDALVPYTEVAVMPAPPEQVLPLRYLVSGGVHLCQDQDGKRYSQGTDFVVDVGRLTFLPGQSPQPGARLAVHYITFPVFLVDVTSHRERIQWSVGVNDQPRLSPEGAIQRLPIQAQVSLEFIPSDINSGGDT